MSLENNYTRDTFPHTHVLKKWYPSLPYEMKSGKILYDSTTSSYFDCQAKKVFSNVEIPPRDLLASDYWENNVGKRNYSEKLKAEFYFNSNNELSAIRYDNGLFLRKGDRIKFVKGEDLKGVTAILDKVCFENGQIVAIAFNLEPKYVTSKGSIVYQSIEEVIYKRANIITVLTNGDIIDELDQDRTYYVVEPHNTKVTGPFTSRGYLGEEFKCFRTKEEGIEYVCGHGMYLSIDSVTKYLAMSPIAFDHNKLVQALLEVSINNYKIKHQIKDDEENYAKGK